MQNNAVAPAAAAPLPTIRYVTAHINGPQAQLEMTVGLLLGPKLVAALQTQASGVFCMVAAALTREGDDEAAQIAIAAIRVA